AGYLERNQSRQVLQVVAHHTGNPGDPDLELESLTLQFEEGPGQPLTSARAARLLQEVRLYSGDGPFDWHSSKPLVTLTSFSLPDGRLTLTLPPGARPWNGFPNFSGTYVTPDGRLSSTLPPGQSDRRLAPGASQTFFVVVKTASTWEMDVPRQF